MQDNIPQLIVHHRKQISYAIIASAVLALLVSVLMPRQYLSEASVLPANSKMMDKQAMFGNNIQELYSAYGASEDLDRLMATMHSPSVLQVVADSAGLVGHYGLSGHDARREALRKLAKHVKLLRTTYGEVNIRVWDKDPAMAKRIAELILYRTQQLYNQLFTDFYTTSLERMETEYKKIRDDSAAVVTPELVREAELIRNRILELKLTRANPPAAMFVLARPEQAVVADKPDILFNIAMAVLVALFTMIAWITGNHFWKSAYAKP